MDGKHFENEAFRLRRQYDNYDNYARVLLKHKCKMTGDCRVFKFLRRSVDGKQLMRFQSETSVFKFLQRSVDGMLLTLLVIYVKTLVFCILAYLKPTGDNTSIFQIHFEDLSKSKLGVLRIGNNLLLEWMHADHFVIYEYPQHRLTVLYSDRYLVPFCEVQRCFTGTFEWR